MRTWMLLLSLLWATSASAERLIVMSEPEQAFELQSALEAALAGRSVAVTSTPPPAGALRLDRAASAQRAAVGMRADAAVWIDRDGGVLELCAVSADGRQFRHAPLPADMSPRVFAAIATSLIDEMVAPPEVNVNVDVHVDVSPGPTQHVDAAPPPPPPAAPHPWDSSVLEAGVAVSPFAVVLEGSLLFAVSDRWRVGPTVFFGAPFVSETGFVTSDMPVQDPAVAALLDVRHSGPGYTHWIIGGYAGAMTVLGDGVFMSGMRFGRVWEGRTLATQLTLSPSLIVADHADVVAPTIWLSLRLGLSL